MHSFEVHSNEIACRKSGRLGLEQFISLPVVESGGVQLPMHHLEVMYLSGLHQKCINRWKYSVVFYVAEADHVKDDGDKVLHGNIYGGRQIFYLLERLLLAVCPVFVIQVADVAGYQ